jgi:hypothetical protein
MRTLSLIFLIAMSFYACNGGSHSHDHGDHHHGEEATEENTENTQELKYTITPFSPSASFPDASIETMTYQAGKFNFGLGGESYQLGVQTPDAEAKMCANSGKGQHIHLIIDDNPYAAKYDASFDYEIEDGEHYLLAFLSRSYHESIKTDAAHVAKKISVADNGITAEKDINEPILFYSRPKGTYSGKLATDKVMLDFYPVNVEIGAEYKVKASINGEDHMLDKWQPYYIEGLPMGENTIELTLVDKDGKKVDTPLNPVKRTFTLEAGE